MKKGHDFLIIDSSVLPEIFLKVLEAKELLDSGKSKNVQDAVMKTGISRSAFYKYRDMVHPFYENSRRRTVTLAMNLENTPGLLSNVLNIVAEFGANILTINQTIPINNIANLTITFEMGDKEPALLFEKIEEVKGVLSIKILARE